MSRTAPAGLALLLGLTLSGCASDGTASGSAPAAESASASAQQSDTEQPSASAVPTDPGASQAKPTADSESVKAVAEDTAKEGAWIDQASYSADPAKYHESGDVVLFFNASWCPTCQKTVRSLDADGVPAGLTVVSVDFDDATDLRKEYGVTVQHTFVQIDEDGKALTKFTGSQSGAAIAARTS